MEFLLRVLVWVVLGATLLLLNVWYGRSLYLAVQTEKRPIYVAPFEIAGRADENERAGKGMARMLTARLPQVRHEISEALRHLQEPRALRREAEADQLAPAAVAPLQPVSTSGRLIVYEAHDIPIKISGLEVKGLVARIQGFLVEDRLYRFTVYGAESSETARVVGILDHQTGRSLYSSCPFDHEAIVERIAHAIVQNEAAAENPNLARLEVEDFQLLIEIAREIAALNRRVLREQSDSTSEGFGEEIQQEFEVQLSRLLPLLDRYGAADWLELMELAAGTAENAGRPELAVALYERALRTVPEGEDETTARLTSLAGTLREEIELREERQREASPLDGEPPQVTSVHRMLDRLGAATLPPMTGSPRIAVVGGLPAGLPEHIQTETLGGGGVGAENGMSDYIRSVVEAAALVAPDATFVFAASPQSRKGLEAIAQEMISLVESKPDVLLLSLGSTPDQDERIFGPALAAALENGVVPVLPAGNTPADRLPFQGKPLLDSLLVASGIDPTGRPTAFTSRGEGSVWAPATNIPVTLGGSTQNVAGTGYSAALVAGAAARLRDLRPDLPATEAVRILRGTSRSLVDGGPQVIHVERAITYVQRSGAAAASERPSP